MSDGISLTVGASVASALIGGICTWLKTRTKQPVQIDPQPLDVRTQKVGPYVTVGECQQHRCALEKRIDGATAAMSKIIDKLDDMDQRSEDRATALHRRMDPFIEKVASTSEAVEILKNSLRPKK